MSAVEMPVISQFLIYALHHPGSQCIYVGKSARGMRRPIEHFRPWHLKAYKNSTSVRWIVSLMARGLKPKIVVLEECTTVADLNEAERFHIAYYRSIGMKLVNCTNGGEGVVGYRHTSESRAKISAVHKGKVTSPETRVRQSLGAIKAAKKFWADPVRSASLIANRTGRVCSADTRARISVKMSALWQTPEYRAKCRRKRESK